MAVLIPTLNKLNQILLGDVLKAISTIPGTRLVAKRNCETYGKRTFAYIDTDSMAERASVEAKLKAAGCRVSTDYNPGHPMVEVQVSYLKARGWNQ